MGAGAPHRTLSLRAGEAGDHNRLHRTGGRSSCPTCGARTLSQAFQTLIEQGFRVGERREPSTIVEAGQVIDTDPPHGFPVSAGLEVIVITSDGLPLVAIPDVQGLLFDTGKLAIRTSRARHRHRDVRTGRARDHRTWAGYWPRRRPPTLKSRLRPRWMSWWGSRPRARAIRLGLSHPRAKAARPKASTRPAQGPPEEPDGTG